MLKRVLVTAGLIRAPLGHPEAGKILMSKRLEGAHLAGSWEFPGGKVELGEDPAVALQRELREELNIEVELGNIYAVGHHSYPTKDIILLTYECWHSGGVPKALEVASFAWLSPHQVCELPLPPADEEVIHRLRTELTVSTTPPPITLQDPPRLTSATGGHSISCELFGLEETRAVGERLGALLRDAYNARQDQPSSPQLTQLPLLIAAHGDLGAGKTSFAQGLAVGLGVSRESYVNSPTFSLLQSHPVTDHTELVFNHLDLYRLEDEDELISLGFDEVVTDGVSFVEWPTRGSSLFSIPHWSLELSYPDEGSESRQMTLTLKGLEMAHESELLSLVLAHIT